MTAETPVIGRAHCNFCGFDGPLEGEEAAKDRALWHLYEHHPLVWASRPDLGVRPSVPRPTYGEV